MTNTNAWTEDRVELLKKLWAEGLSASQIAARLGDVTRNAVIGKVSRLNLPQRATTSRKAQNCRSRAIQLEKQQAARDSRGRFAAMARAANEARKAAMELTPVAPVLATDEQPAFEAEDEDEVCITSSGVSFFELREKHCRWPLGEKNTIATHYCGCPKTPGKPYCPSHCADAFQVRQRFRPARQVILSNELKLPSLEAETL